MITNLLPKIIKKYKFKNLLKKDIYIKHMEKHYGNRKYNKNSIMTII
jgi:hypothetical protein